MKTNFPKVQNIRGFEIGNKGSNFKVVDLNGFQHDAKVININNRFDLCLLQVSDVLMNPPVLNFSRKRTAKRRDCN